MSSTTASLQGNPAIVAGMASLKVVFSQTVVGATNPANFQLKSSGVDQAFDTSDDVTYPVTSSYIGSTATLAFARLPVGTYRFTVLDAIKNGAGNALDGDADGSAGGNWVRNFSIIPSAATKYELTGVPSTVDAGAVQSVTVTALDAYGNLATGYRGTMSFTSNDPTAVLPASYTFTAANAGRVTLPLTFNTIKTGTWYRVADQATGFNKSQTGITVVSPIVNVLSSFAIEGLPGTTIAGTPNSFSVTALNQFGSPMLDYLGTVRFTSDDPLASTPLDYTFIPSDDGERPFSLTLKTAGVKSLQVTDLATGINQTISVNVSPAALAGFDVSGVPLSVVQGVPQTAFMSARDAYGNLIPTYVGTVSFSSSDPAALLPGPVTFAPGDLGQRSFGVTFVTTGSNRSVTATDTVTGAFGRQAGITVTDNTWIRFSDTSNTIYVDGIDATLTEIKLVLPAAPLTLLNPFAAIWKLDANIRVINGGSLTLKGTSLGGDVNELRLRSENVLSPNAIVEVRAEYGNIFIEATKIYSWDSVVNGPDTEHETYGRAYIRVRSYLSPTGLPLESRMDIKSSELSYLGYDGSESYGLSWKVIGDPGPNYELYDAVDVFGDVINNSIHHNYFGIFTFGAQGMNIVNNDASNNTIYGIDPHDDSDYLLIEGNTTRFNGHHGIICSKRCDNIVIRNNVSSDNGKHGIMLHRNVDYSLVEGNLTERNGEAGIAVYDSRYNVVRNNIARYNLFGTRVTMGSAYNVFYNNDFSFNLDRGINVFPGSDPPSPGNDTRPKFNTFSQNTVTFNGGYGIRLQNADANLFESNYVVGNGYSNGVLIEFGTNNRLKSNNFGGVIVARVVGSATVPSVLYLESQPGVTPLLGPFASVIIV